jgi:hypothetical protein
VSFTVQYPPSSHTVPFARLGWVHAPPEQVSFVQALPSSVQLPVRAGCVHTPAAQVSVVHSFPSSAQGPVCAGCVHTPAAQVSAVHGFPSSVQLPVRGAKTQPVAGAQLSFVHSRLSLQMRGNGPAPHPPVALQASPRVQRLLSEHAVPAGAGGCELQPVTGLQGSSVQGFESLQLSGAVARQKPAVHCSTPLQTLPSEQEVPFGAGACRQPSTGSHVSVVQGLPSLQFST